MGTIATGVFSAKTWTSRHDVLPIIKYSNGVTMSYSLNAYHAVEGFRVAFNGEKGGSKCGTTNANLGRWPKTTRPKST